VDVRIQVLSELRYQPREIEQEIFKFLKDFNSDRQNMMSSTRMAMLSMSI